MKKLTKSVKIILISSVAVLCALAVIFGCVFGIKKPKPNDTTPPIPPYKLTDAQIALGNAVNSHVKSSKVVKEFDSNFLKNESGDEIAKYEDVYKFLNSGYYVATGGSGGEPTVGEFYVYRKDNDRKYASPVKELLDLEGVTNYAVTGVVEDYIAYEYNYVDETDGKKYKVHEVAYIKDLNNIVVVNEFVAEVNGDGSLSYEDGYNMFQIVLYDNYYYAFGMSVVGEQSAMGGTIYVYGYTTTEVKAGEFASKKITNVSDLSFAQDYDNGYVLVYDSVVNIYYVNGSKVSETSFAMQTNLNVDYVLVSAGLFIENKELTINNSETSVYEQTGYYNYSYKFFDFKNNKLVDLPLTSGYAKMSEIGRAHV